MYIEGLQFEVGIWFRVRTYQKQNCEGFALFLLYCRGVGMRVGLGLGLGLGQDATRQDKTRQDKTRQDKMRQDTTRDDKTI